MPEWAAGLTEAPVCWVSVQADNINTIVKAAGVTVEPYWPGLFAKLFSKKSVEDLIANVGAGMSCLAQNTPPTAAAVTVHDSSSTPV